MQYINTIESSIVHVKNCIEMNKEDQYKNKATDYLPIGPGGPEKQKLDWDKVNQVLMEDLFQLSIKNRDKEHLKIEILKSFKNSRDTKELVNIVDSLYLSTNAINNITPLAYLVSNQETPKARTQTMISIVQGLLISPLNTGIELDGNNPLETLIINKVHALCEHKVFDSKRTSYLPFLAEMFTKDIKTLSKDSNYFLNELESLLKLYTFLYLTQLTIQLCIPDNRFKLPTAKPLYFILETESASRERHECNQFGYDYLFSNTRGMALSLFPLLGYFSQITSHPIWTISIEGNNNLTQKVNELNKAIAMLFNEECQNADSLDTALNKGAAFQKQVFEESLASTKKGSRKSANKSVVQIFESIFSTEFITNRKSAGKYLVLNSNVLILLTNLIIKGSSESRLLIDDVIEGFKQRGIWFDLKSRKALLKFYENVGNIEKLSDSGDAVYVKSTI